MAVFNPSESGHSVRENRKALVWSREISVAHFRTIALATRILVDLKRAQGRADFIPGVCRQPWESPFLSHLLANIKIFDIKISK